MSADSPPPRAAAPAQRGAVSQTRVSGTDTSPPSPRQTDPATNHGKVTHGQLRLSKSVLAASHGHVKVTTTLQNHHP